MDRALLWAAEGKGGTPTRLSLAKTASGAVFNLMGETSSSGSCQAERGV